MREFDKAVGQIGETTEHFVMWCLMGFAFGCILGCLARC